MATEVVYRETRRRYRWPEVQLNLWIFIVLAGASTVLGINAWFISVQQQMRIGIPWYVCIRGETLLKHSPALTSTPSQAIYFCRGHRRPHHHLPHHHPRPRCTPHADTGWHITRRIHTFRPLGDNTDRDRHSAVRSWER